MAVRFLYFDLGNVLLTFSHRQAAEQMAAVAKVPFEAVWKVVFEDGLEQRFEAGAITSQQFYKEFCRGVGAMPDYEGLLLAGSEIFEVNSAIIPLIGQLRAVGHRLGILSNTCEPHWAYCSRGRYGLIGKMFDKFALSFEIGACKPDARIFAAAAKLAGTPPDQIFFTDDIPSHVAAAKEAGWDAVQFTTVPALAAELRSRDIKCNY
jgi:putative hydrolase of the HAD superfamily